MTRFIAFAISIAFVGCLCLVACEDQNKPKDTGTTGTTTPPKAPEAPKTPPAPTTPTTPAPKTSDATPANPLGGAIASINTAANKVADMTKCGMEGCGKAIDPKITPVTFEGKAYGFCCADCQAGFKKAKNIN